MFTLFLAGVKFENSLKQIISFFYDSVLTGIIIFFKTVNILLYFYLYYGIICAGEKLHVLVLIIVSNVHEIKKQSPWKYFYVLKFHILAC